MINIDTSKLKIDNQGDTGHCGGFTFAKIMEIITGKHYDGNKLWKLIDDTMEKSNKGGIAVANILEYLRLYGFDGVKVKEWKRISKYPKGVSVRSTLNSRTLKDLIDNYDIVIAKIQGFRYNRASKIFYPSSRKGSHMMPVVKVEGSRVYVWNSWGDGLASFDINKIPYVSLYGAKIAKDNKKIIPQKKYKYFSDKEVRGLKPELVMKLDEAREIAGIPFVINSGFRTKERNKEVGGVPDSSHLYGLAVDLRARNSTERYKILKSLFQVGFRRIGVGSTFIHCDIDQKKPKDVVWLYNK